MEDVVAQIAASSALSRVFLFSFEVSLSTINTKFGMDNTSRQATTSKQVDIFFKEKDFLSQVLFRCVYDVSGRL